MMVHNKTPFFRTIIFGWVLFVESINFQDVVWNAATWKARRRSVWETTTEHWRNKNPIEMASWVKWTAFCNCLVFPIVIVGRFIQIFLRDIHVWSIGCCNWLVVAQQLGITALGEIRSEARLVQTGDFAQVYYFSGSRTSSNGRVFVVSIFASLSTNPWSKNVWTKSEESDLHFCRSCKCTCDGPTWAYDRDLLLSISFSILTVRGFLPCFNVRGTGLDPKFLCISHGCPCAAYFLMHFLFWSVIVGSNAKWGGTLPITAGPRSLQSYLFPVGQFRCMPQYECRLFLFQKCFGAGGCFKHNTYHHYIDNKSSCGYDGSIQSGRESFISYIWESTKNPANGPFGRLRQQNMGRLELLLAGKKFWFAVRPKIRRCELVWGDSVLVTAQRR